MSAVIAERILHIEDENGQIEVPVRIYAPALNDAGSWVCQVEIAWPLGSWKQRVGGLDSVQALELAFKMIGANLYTCDLHREGRLVWKRSRGEYGFPVAANIRGLLVGDERDFF